MSVPGFDDPALAAPLEHENTYFTPDLAVQTGPGTRPGRWGYTAGGPAGQPVDSAAPRLMFGTPETHTPEGAPVVTAKEQTKGHVSDVLNFRGSPAPWILIGILIVAGVIHLSANAKGAVRV